MPDPADVQRLFESALVLSPEQREEFVNAQTDDPALREEVLGLLRHHELAGETLDTAAAERFASLLLPAGDSLGEFTLIRELGRGGMGVVYLARDEELGRLVAVKLLNDAFFDSELAVGRLRHEAKALAGLSHPSIVPVYSYGHGGDRHFLVMEYVEGRTFEQWLAEAVGGTGADLSGNEAHPGASPDLLNRDQIREAVSVLIQIGDAIQYAHDQGVIHRDLKPSNILLGTDGHAKVTDFGIAIVAADPGHTMTAELIGTPYYMSPEQAGALAKQLDFRTDIFSLGVGLYRVLTSRLPFTGESMPSILHSICHSQPLSPRSINPVVDRDLTTICLKALEKAPQERYQSAAHFAADLRSWLRGDPILASPPTLAKRVKHLVKRRPVLTVTAVSLIAVVGLATYALMPSQGTRARLQIESPGADGARVFSRLLKNQVGEGWGGEYLGQAPLDRLVEPGVHRISIVQDNTRFAQTVRRLLPAETVVLELPVRSAVENDSVLIPAGVYTVGDPNGNGVFAERDVHVEAFRIDLTEVSNAQYKAFLDETDVEGMVPYSWQGTFPIEWADRPVTAVRHQWMQAYAAWAGKRLPTMEEWEAAWQTAGPFGGAPLNTARERLRAAATEEEVYRVYGEFAVSVLAPPEQRGGGLPLSHMAGNAREATSTRDPNTGYGIVLMGACFGDGALGTDKAMVSVMPPTGAPDVQVGFRCVRSVRTHSKEIEP